MYESTRGFSASNAATLRECRSLRPRVLLRRNVSRANEKTSRSSSFLLRVEESLVSFFHFQRPMLLIERTRASAANRENACECLLTNTATVIVSVFPRDRSARGKARHEDIARDISSRLFLFSPTTPGLRARETFGSICTSMPRSRRMINVCTEFRCLADPTGHFSAPGTFRGRDRHR